MSSAVTCLNYIEKRLDNPLVEPEVMSEQEARRWNNWLNAHLNELREEIIDAVANAIVDLRRERDAAIAQEVSRLKIEIAVLRGELKACASKRRTIAVWSMSAATS